MDAKRREAWGWTSRGRRAIAAGLAVIAMTTGTAQAAGLSVSPVSVQFQSEDVAQGLWLNNSSDRTMRAQVRVFEWAQDRDDDRLTPSTALVVSPPMLNIEPGQRQFVRIVRPPNVRAERELSYRLLIDELPDAAQSQRPGLHFVMRYSVPVFLAPASAPATASSPPQPRLRQGPDGLVLSIDNTGARRVQVTDLELRDAQNRVVHRHDGLLGYVLAGHVRDWTLKTVPQAGSAGPLTLAVQFNGQRIQQTLPVLAAPASAP